MFSMNMGPLNPKDVLSQAASLIKESKYGIALTGAGLSTESGIPDFRSPGGLWSEFDPEEIGSAAGFEESPQKFFQMALKIGPTLLAARPNPGHRALAQLEKGGWLKGIITQNIDGLHQKAGTKRVAEIHGTIYEVTCPGCPEMKPVDILVQKGLVERQMPPLCDTCGGILRPNVVFFGEMLPSQQVTRAKRWVDKCDLMLVAGSSLEVTPVCLFPVVAKNNGARLIFVNDETTRFDNLADIILRGKTGSILPKILKQIREMNGNAP